MDKIKECAVYIVTILLMKLNKEYGRNVDLTKDQVEHLEKIVEDLIRFKLNESC